MYIGKVLYNFYSSSTTYFVLYSGIYFWKVNKQSKEEILVRKSRYENFSSVFPPESREMFIISGSYYDTDIACFPSSAHAAGDQIQNNIRIDVVGQQSLESSSQQNKSETETENDDNDNNLSPQQIEIPSSRRSSFHGDSMDIARSYRESSPVPLITVSPTRNKLIE